MSGPILTRSPDHEVLRDTVRRFFSQRSPEPVVRTLMATESGYDPAMWREMTDQLGFTALAVPADYGGTGYGFIELAVVLEEMGRALLCAPFFATAVLATGALLASGDDAACRRYLPAIAAGATVATVAAGWDGLPFDVAATEHDGRWQLTGRHGYVLDGTAADLILVAAQTGGTRSLFAVTADAAGLKRSPLPTLDLTRKLADLEFAGTPARLIAAVGAGDDIVERVRQRAAIGLAAEQVGGAQRVLESAVAYAGTRIQFGVPIGSFQAIKHMCADALVAVESARSTAHYAAWALESGEDVAVAASMAKAYCSEAFTAAATANLQVHGGIGFTWEDGTHLYLKRAKSSEALFGSPRVHRAALAAQLGLTRP